MGIQSTALVNAVAIIHPAFLEPSDADKVAAPLCIIDSKDEDVKVVDALEAALRKKPFGDKVFRKRYGNIFHGFCAGRANYGDEENAKYAREVPSLHFPLA